MQSSLDYQEAAHKLLKMKIPDSMQVSDVAKKNFRPKKPTNHKI